VDDTSFEEEHYTVAQLAERWKYGRESIRKLMMNEPGVLKMQLGRNKKNTHYSIPASVARRVHTRLTNRQAA
jgi:hypothetical protein